jgi:bacitracin synthase 3
MVPAIYMRLESMPVTPNGKIDRKALPEPEIAAGKYVEPVGDTEQAVAGAMQKILNMKTAPGALDSFFELGGDSIKAIRLSSLLRDLDLAVSVADIMRQKTVRGIAGAAQSKKGPEISQQPFEGDVEETPIVAFFRDLHLPEPWHYNQTELFLLRDRMTTEELQRIFNALTVQHDMLRAIWADSRLTVRPADTVILIEEYSAASEEEITAICREIQSHIRMEEALVRAALIHAPDTDCFCLACHHLVIDGVSWRIIGSDLETAFAQDRSGKTIQLPRKTQPYADYARAIRKYLDSYRLAQEVPYWNAVQKKLEALPLSDGKDYSREFARLTVTMSAEDTEWFLRTNFDAFGLTLSDALLTAVCRSCRQVSGDRPVSVQLEGHGREVLDEVLYTDRTVGWFTSVYPVVFEGLTGEMRRDLTAVKETLHRIPNKGVGYNVLRYVGGKDALNFHTDRIPPLCFNYLGEMDEGSPEEEKQFRPANIDKGDDISPRNTEGPGLSINCLTRGGVFTLTIDYDTAESDPGQAERIAGGILEEMRQIAGYLSETHESMTTASDLGETEWSAEEFEAVMADFESRGEGVERIYPLLPMQESMLLKHLQEPEAWGYRLVDIFEMDWVPTQAQLRHVLDRLGTKHEVLRTSILYKNVSVPRQAIIDRPLGLAMVDLTADADPEASVKRLREEILTHGYDLQDKPLLSLTCAKVSDSRCYLVQAQHHIITDGWCTALYMEDLTRYLQEEMTGQFTEDVASVRGRYEEAVREILHKDMRAGLDYWRELLSGYETRAEIPSFGTVPENERSEEDLLTVVLDTEKTRQLEQLCGQEGATLNNAVELAWGMVLGVCSRTQDAVFAKVVSGRDNTETKVDDLVGLFINSVPVRVKWDDRTSVKDALRALNRQAARSNAYDYCPLSDIQQQTDLGSELLQSVMAFENFAGGREIIEEVTILKPLELREEIFSAINPVSYVENGQLTFCITFDTGLYRGEEVRRLLSMFRMLLEGMIRNPNRALTTLDLLDDDGIREIIARSKGEILAYDPRGTWLDLFRNWVKERPDHAAVVDSEGNYTYAELDQASNAVAAWLIDQGVRENSFVALCMGRVKEFAAAVIGVHKAGAAYVPVDPEYPEDRIAFMLEDSEAKVTLDMEMVRKIVSAGENAPDICLAKPENRAYMIYTSGSTGKPKGVVQPHSSLRTMLAWLVNIVGENAVDVLHPSFSFDASINDLFGSLSAGGQVHILADGLRKDPAAMDRYIREYGITGMTVSTQIGMALINQFPDMPIQFMMMGGEKMLPCEKTDIQLINGYGPTEFTVCSSYHIVNREKDMNIPIGRPVPNTWSLICDDHGRLLPRGMAGELCLAGPQIAEGYWKRPELTAKVFVDCPWLPGEKMYRTGDMARYNENDELEYLGRIDNQVKLRGFRIELGEIENRASQYERISAVSAQVRRDTLVLYYTSEGEIDPDALKAFLAETLTEYMVPEIIMRLENMPMTPNGKINLKALPDPDISDRQAPYAPPRNPFERTLCEAFAEVLGLDAETFGIYDDFFALGGNSIRCMKAVSVANIRQLSISDIYRLKTPARISEALFGMEDDDINEEQARRMSVTATPGQLSMMDYQFTHAKSVMYNIPSLYRIDDSIGDDRFAEAVNAVIRNHPALCTVFEPDEEHDFVQRCCPDLLSPVQWEDIAPEDIHDTIDGLVMPFTSFRRPLFRIRLLRCGRLRYLFMDMHHMISDGFSVGVLRENIQRAVRGEPLPEDYYYTFLLREQKAAQTTAYAEARQYFGNLLGDTDWCNIPKPDFASWDSEGAEEMIGLSLTMKQMEEAEARLKVTGNVICLAAGALAMREYSNREDVLLNWINDNRSRAGNESTVGLLFKILPVALHMDEYPDEKTLIEEIRRQTDAGFAHSICNYQEITEKALEDSIEINYLPGLDDGEEGADETGILEGVELADRHSAAGERVGMYIGDMDGGLAVSCSYQKRIYAPGSMQRFLELFRKHLRAIVLYGSIGKEER